MAAGSALLRWEWRSMCSQVRLTKLSGWTRQTQVKTEGFHRKEMDHQLRRAVTMAATP